MSTLIQDLKYGLRVLAKNPGFTAVVVITLALGIGATSALFTVVRSVLLRPLPFKDPGRLMRLYEHSTDDKSPYNWIAAGMFAEWKKQSHGFSDLAIFSPWDEYNLSGAGGKLPEKVHASEVSWNLFPTLGVEPALGRGFTASDDQPSANATVVLSWGLWQRRFGGDPSILNRTIHLDAQPHAVIGIMPSWFAYPDQSTQLWTPIYHQEKSHDMQDIASHNFWAIGRLKSAVTEKEATAELSVITRRLHDQHLDNPFVSKAASSRPLLESMVGDIKTPLYILLAATGCLLLIACLNVASLLVARGGGRRRELAIRTALGGSRWRLLGEHLIESLLLSAGGGATGLLLAYAVVQWFIAVRPDMSRVEAVHMDGWVAAFVLGLAFACAIFASLTSSLSIRGAEILSALQESSRSHSAGHRQVRLRQWLLTLEVSLTVVVLIGAGLLLKGYKRMRSADLGCITRNVLTMTLSLPEAKYSQGTQRVNFYRTLLERVRSLPGVTGAGLARVVPGESYGGASDFVIAEHPPLPPGKGRTALVRWADPGYFAALGIPLMRGRTFDEAQQLEKARETIISESFARHYFPGEDPLGKHLIACGHRPFEIVGVVGDTRYQISEPVQPMMYFPLYAIVYGDVPNGGTLAVRSSRDVTSLAIPIQRIVQGLDPELAVADVLTMDQIIGRSTLDASFDATLLAAFAVFSLILAAIGLFGVLSYIVAQRTQEIGIRIALGAQKGNVLRLVIGQGMIPALVGLGLGISAGLGLTRFMSSLLYGVKPTDPLTFVAVSLLLTCVALLASYIPARRATKVDPVVALRYE
jgi:predicted permease